MIDILNWIKENPCASIGIVFLIAMLIEFVGDYLIEIIKAWKGKL